MIGAVDVPPIRQCERCRLFTPFHDFARPARLTHGVAVSSVVTSSSHGPSQTSSTLCDLTERSTTKETSMAKTPQRRDSKKVGKTLTDKREAKRAKQQDKKPLER